MGSISTTKRSLQRVGQNIKPKINESVSYKNSGFPKGCKPYGNGGSVVVSNHKGNQLSNFCLLPTGIRLYSLDTKQKMNLEIKQDIELSYKQLFDINIFKTAYQTLKSKPGNMTPGTDKETLDAISIR